MEQLSVRVFAVVVSELLTAGGTEKRTELPRAMAADARAGGKNRDGVASAATIALASAFPASDAI